MSVIDKLPFKIKIDDKRILVSDYLMAKEPGFLDSHEKIISHTLGVISRMAWDGEKYIDDEEALEVLMNLDIGELEELVFEFNKLYKEYLLLKKLFEKKGETR